MLDRTRAGEMVCSNWVRRHLEKDSGSLLMSARNTRLVRWDCMACRKRVLSLNRPNWKIGLGDSRSVEVVRELDLVVSAGGRVSRRGGAAQAEGRSWHREKRSACRLRVDPGLDSLRHSLFNLQYPQYSPQLPVTVDIGSSQHVSESLFLAAAAQRRQCPAVSLPLEFEFDRSHERLYLPACHLFSQPEYVRLKALASFRQAWRPYLYRVVANYPQQPPEPQSVADYQTACDSSRNRKLRVKAELWRSSRPATGRLVISTLLTILARPR